MSQSSRVLRAVYVDGETKTGKGSASRAISESLKKSGYNVYYDVAGDFYRRFVALVRIQLGLKESEPLPVGDALERAATQVYESQQAFDQSESLGDLQRVAISKSVSILGELSVAQKAGREWWALSLQRAQAAGADIIVFDARNPRARVTEQLTKIDVPVRTALELYMACEAHESARRLLVETGNQEPSKEEIEHEAHMILARRERDRSRVDTPFVIPEVTVDFDPQKVKAVDLVPATWQRRGDMELPLTVAFDNTHISKQAMHDALSELALTAVSSMQLELEAV